MTKITHKKSKYSSIGMIDPDEDSIQEAVIEWAQYHPICSEYLIHIANQGKRSISYGSKLKRMGLRSGASDLFLSYPNSIYHGFWIELKTRTGIVSPQQKLWGESVSKAGYKFSVIRDSEECINAIMKYLGETKITRTKFKEE